MLIAALLLVRLCIIDTGRAAITVILEGMFETLTTD